MQAKTVYPFYSEAKSFLHLKPFYRVIPCGKTENVQVQYVINPLDLEKGARSVNFYYTVVGKDGILSYGTRAIQLRGSSSLNGTLQVPITFTLKYGTAPKMIGFLLLKNGTVVADRLFIDVDMCFPNSASLKFSSSESIPKAKISLTLSSSAGSVCALRAVDKSVQISFEDKELTKEMVFSLFPYSVRGGYPDEVAEYGFYRCFYYTIFLDVFSLFKDVGLKILTNMQIKAPEQRRFCPIFFVNRLEAQESQQPVPVPVSSSQDVVRKYFPETWLWSLVEIGRTGNTTITVTVPDTITQFNAGTFCMGNIGFGLSSQVSLTVFQPFFVDLALPYSVIQGETLTLKALVFNYLTQCLKVQVTLLSSSYFTIQDCKDCVYIKCICADESTNFNWNITANKIGFVTLTVRAEAITSTDKCAGQVVYVPPTGNLDILEKQLLVKPQGITNEVAQSMFICLKDSIKNVERNFSLEVPKNLVKDSESAYISVTGDVLGTALQNLDMLVAMPYGCGEQNMLTMAPIIYVLDYLSATGQLGSSLQANALSYLQSGYQRELNYKHMDGSYSAFGESDGEGSTWLTAFVMKCFYQAKKYIFIDDQVLGQAMTWLANNQNNDGCFINRGKLFHTLMKGGVNDDVSLCAYITAALLERGGSVAPIKLDLALSCLRANVSATTNPYTLALMAYTFTLANDTQTRQILLSRLNQLASSSGNDLYWNTFSPLQGPAVSGSVELTSYVLLAMISGLAPTSEELTNASRIVGWISKQQNPYGGFASTQDTVVAIQALAKYTKITFNPSSNVLVTVSVNKVALKQFKVDNTNRLLLQKQPLTTIPGNYQLSINGNGCILIQIVLKYNVLLVAEKSPFTISAIIDQCGIKYGQYGLLTLTVRYDGPRPTTNMVLIEVELLSGFSVTDDTKPQLLTSPFVKRVDVGNDLITIYLEELNHETQKYYIGLVQDMVIYDLKPANVKIYDYYENEDSATTSYSPCPPPIRKN